MDQALLRLLEPISADAPCGPDLGYDPRFAAIETILRGKPEVDLGSVKKPAEPPDWGALKGACLEFLVASKHLRPAVILCCVLVKTDGLGGFRDGLQLLRGWLEKYWSGLYPLLDPTDNNDPQQRLSIISGLTAVRNSFGQGWLQVIEYLHGAPLCRPKDAPAVTLDLVLAAAEQKGPTADGSAPAAPAGPDAAVVAAQFRGVKPEEIVATHSIAVEALAALQGIDALLDSILGAGGSISFEELESTLQRIERTLAAYVTGAGGGPPGDPAAPGRAEEPEGPDGGGPGFAVTGSIRSRTDVVRVLESVCDYYRQREPGSPVPFLLRRAQKLAVMNFVEAMHELSLATPDQLRPSMGSAVDTPPAT